MSDITVSAASISVVHDRLSKLIHMTELFGSIWRSIDSWEETARLILLSWTVHSIETSIVIENVCISSSAIYFITDISKPPVEVGMRGFRVRNQE